MVDRLLRAAESEILGRGETEAYLGVFSNNQSAITAYERNGYQEISGSAHTLPPELDPDQVAEMYYKKSLS